MEKAASEGQAVNFKIHNQHCSLYLCCQGECDSISWIFMRSKRR